MTKVPTNRDNSLNLQRNVAYLRDPDARLRQKKVFERNCNDARSQKVVLVALLLTLNRYLSIGKTKKITFSSRKITLNVTVKCYQLLLINH